MLVQFTVKNVLSFKEEATLDMTAINAYKEHKCNLIDIGKKEKFIRVAAIYGANASGKSNFYLAMRYFQKIVLESLNSVEEGKSCAIEKYYYPFMFDEKNENSEFQIVEILGDFEYCYGFEYNADFIASEWLYRKNLNTNRRVMIFERTRELISFGPSVKKECEVFQEQIPAETLVLTFFNKLKLKTDIFRKLYKGIMSTLIASADSCENPIILDKFLPEIIDSDKEKLIEFINAIDTGIKDIDYDDSDKEMSFITYHTGKEGEEYELDLYSESEGTIKSIALFIYAWIAVPGNGSMFVDELNVKLHPLLLKFIIDLFYEEKSRAQLIYTTHDTTLMDKKFFRRDQIWFVQKDEFGYSELSALSDYKVRSDASFEKDYLSGVYGGIPFLKEFKLRSGR